MERKLPAPTRHPSQCLRGNSDPHRGGGWGDLLARPSPAGACRAGPPMQRARPCSGPALVSRPNSVAARARLRCRRARVPAGPPPPISSRRRCCCRRRPRRLSPARTWRPPLGPPRRLPQNSESPGRAAGRLRPDPEHEGARPAQRRPRPLREELLRPHPAPAPLPRLGTAAAGGGCGGLRHEAARARELLGPDQVLLRRGAARAAVARWAGLGARRVPKLKLTDANGGKGGAGRHSEGAGMRKERRGGGGEKGEGREESVERRDRRVWREERSDRWARSTHCVWPPMAGPREALRLYPQSLSLSPNSLISSPLPPPTPPPPPALLRRCCVRRLHSLIWSPSRH